MESLGVHKIQGCGARDPKGLAGAIRAGDGAWRRNIGLARHRAGEGGDPAY
jgi:hypothetical protein